MLAAYPGISKSITAFFKVHRGPYQPDCSTKLKIFSSESLEYCGFKFGLALSFDAASVFMTSHPPQSLKGSLKVNSLELNISCPRKSAPMFWNVHYCTVCVWNILSEDIVKADQVGSFVRRIICYNFHMMGISFLTLSYCLHCCSGHFACYFMPFSLNFLVQSLCWPLVSLLTFLHPFYGPTYTRCVSFQCMGGWINRQISFCIRKNEPMSENV